MNSTRFRVVMQQCVDAARLRILYGCSDSLFDTNPLDAACCRRGQRTYAPNARPIAVRHRHCGRRDGETSTDRPKQPTVSGKDPEAVARGAKGGLKGGKARAVKMTAAQRKTSAKKAAEVRWGKR